MLRSGTPVVVVASAAALFGLAGPAHAVQVNLVVNGGFEAPDQASGTWAVYPSIPGWLGSGCGIEVQDHVAGNPWEGDQLVELDSNCSSTMAQTLPTVAGRWYTITWAYSPRPGVADNAIDITWNGGSVGNINASGVGNADTVWTLYSESVQATSASSVLAFADGGPSNSLGGYLDNVGVVASPAAAVDACKNGGWMNYVDNDGRPFKNQGDCVSFVATGGKNVAAG